jgi:hypothetical protein
MSLRRFLYCCLLLGFSADAWAWGLQTHAFFAQALLWLVPLTDPRLRKAASKLPQLILAGACLPDLALTSAGRIPALDASHDWETAARLLAEAGSDEERALALGFASHLLTDIVAHNHFVPAHEMVWLDVPLVTHVAAEWAMDCYIARQLFVEPAVLLTREQSTVEKYVAQSFFCSAAQACTAMQSLARAESLLRRSGLPLLAFSVGRTVDRRLDLRFRHYLAHTLRRLPQINRLAAGEQPSWGANPCPNRAKAALADVPGHLLRTRLPLPADLFASA